jgi:uncharacterized delta-60 repeat protein
MSHINNLLASTAHLRRWMMASLLCLFFIALGAGSVAAQSARDGFSPGADDIVRTLLVQADGKILVGGDFTHIDLPARNHLARLEASGALDTSFNPNLDGNVYALAIQPDGAVLAGGDFAHVGPVARGRLARLSSGGALDSAFAPSPNGAVHAIVVLDDGKLLVAGAFTQIGGQARPYLARLNSDGAIETSFDPAINGAIYALVLQRDGALVIGGDFTQVDGQARSRIARLDADGNLDAAFNPGANGAVRALDIQFGGKIVIGGDFTQVGGQARRHLARVTTTGALEAAPALDFSHPVHSVRVLADDSFLAGGAFLEVGGQPLYGLARFARDGAFDADFTPNANGAVYAIREQPNASIVIGGAFLNVGAMERRRLARLYADGRLDADFAPVADGGVKALAIQPDGKVLVGGAFAAINGQPRNRFARLLADGTLDTVFAPNFTSLNPDIWAVAVQPDGKILVAGSFTAIDGETHQNVARLNANGSVDSSFAATTDGYVLALALQPDGKIVIGGDFKSVNGVQRHDLARLNADGTLDAAFRADTDGSVVTVALQADGKILAGGEFGIVTGQLHDNLVRLHPDGTVDATYTASANTFVYTVALQADGRAIIGGTFFQVNGVTRNSIARLNIDGTLDTTFNPNAEDGGFVYSLAIQADGSIIVAGNFTVIGGQIRNRLARFTAGGQLDMRYNPNVNQGVGGVVFATALQKDGKLVIGGSFGDVAEVARANLARLSADPSAVQALQADPGGGAINWELGGGGPNFFGATFEYSLDGSVYAPLGAGERTATGWRVVNAALPFNQEFLVRAHGVFASGGFNASHGAISAAARTFVAGGVLEIATVGGQPSASPEWVVSVAGPTGHTVFTFALATNATTGNRNVGASVYTITLAAGATTTASDYITTYACTIDGQPGPSGVGASFQVAVNVTDITHCAFTNTRRTGMLDVMHKIEPSAAASSWDLRINGPVTGTAVLTGDASTGVQPVLTGAYTLNLDQRGDARYTTNYTCTVNSQPLVTGGGTTVTIAIADTQTVVCIFTSRDFYVHPPHRVLLPNVRR